MSSSVPGLFNNPSWGKTQICKSIAHLYSSIRGRMPSRLRRPTTGSTSRWVRMWVVPCRMLFSRVRMARSRTSVRREVLLGLGHSSMASVEIALLGLAAVQDAGLVQVDMGLDEAGRHQAAVDVYFAALRRQSRLDGGDAPRLDADVDRRLVLGASDARSSR